MTDHPARDAGTPTVEALPCPFCNATSTSQITTQGDKWGNLACTDCGACGPEVRTSYTVPEEWLADAVEAWNRRAALPAASAEPKGERDTLATGDGVRVAPERLHSPTPIGQEAESNAPPNLTSVPASPRREAVEAAIDRYVFTRGLAFRHDPPNKEASETCSAAYRALLALYVPTAAPTKAQIIEVLRREWHRERPAPREQMVNEWTATALLALTVPQPETK